MKTTIQLVVILFLLASSVELKAQNFYKEKISRNYIFSFGVGPSFAYIDNGGPYRDFTFEVKPSVSAALTKRITPKFDVRATMGYQSISSSGNASQNVQNHWTLYGSAYTAKGPAYFLDIMPSWNLIPFPNHMLRSMFNLYGGVGLGIINVTTEQTFSFSSEESPTRHSVTTGYVPFRIGLSYTLGPYSDIAGEGTMLFTFSDNLDGNENFNRFGDHLGQAQIVYRRYFRPKNR